MEEASATQTGKKNRAVYAPLPITSAQLMYCIKPEHENTVFPESLVFMCESSHVT